MRQYRLYLFGYGAEKDAYQRLLPLCHTYQIPTIFDIRDKPFSSSRPAWNKSSLESVCGQNNIEYRHMESLGNLPQKVGDKFERSLPWNRPKNAQEGLHVLQDHLFVQARSALLLCCEGRGFEYKEGYKRSVQDLLHRQMVPFISRCHRIDVANQIRLDWFEHGQEGDQFNCILLEPDGSIFEIFLPKYLVYHKTLPDINLGKGELAQKLADGMDIITKEES